jgi:hypothetical protein
MSNQHLLEKVEYKGYTIEVYSDEFADSPREHDEMAQFFFFHRRYRLGDENPLKAEDFSGWAEMQKKLQKEFRLVVPVYMYDHGSISLSTSPFSCPWDSGQIGFACAHAEDIRRTYGVKRITKEVKEKAIRYIEGEVETYSKYVGGDFCYYRVLRGSVEIDSCSSIQDCELAVSMAKEHVDFIEDMDAKAMRSAGLEPEPG